MDFTDKPVSLEMAMRFDKLLNDIVHMEDDELEKELDMFAEEQEAYRKKLIEMFDNRQLHGLKPKHHPRILWKQDNIIRVDFTRV